MTEYIQRRPRGDGCQLARSPQERQWPWEMETSRHPMLREEQADLSPLILESWCYSLSICFLIWCWILEAFSRHNFRNRPAFYLRPNAIFSPCYMWLRLANWVSICIFLINSDRCLHDLDRAECWLYRGIPLQWPHNEEVTAKIDGVMTLKKREDAHFVSWISKIC